MVNQTNTIPASPQPPQKPKRSIRLLIILGLTGLCLCLIIIFAVVIMSSAKTNLLNTNAPQVNISAGTLNGTIYTAPEGIFSCDFIDLLYGGQHPYFIDRKLDKNGTVFGFNDYGNQYGVDYFNTFLWGGDDLVKSLSDPKTRQKSLEAFVENPLLSAKSQKAQVTHQEFITNDILFVVINNPEASNLVQEINGVTIPLDYQEGYYIFAGKEWFYFVNFNLTPHGDLELIGPLEMQNQVESFYENCKFQP
jgi:hypothetical protein